MAELLQITSADGVVLEGELAPAVGAPRAAMAICHPHPQFGGSMRSIVVSALFDALPHLGVVCLRFNFRGVEGSEGHYDDGRAEGEDVASAVDTLAGRVDPALPLLLAGWSFGADMALSVGDSRVTGWLAIAPPLRFARELDRVAFDPRPKLLVLAQHDEFRDPAEVADLAERWVSCEVEVVGGASHFFIGRTGRLVEVATAFVDRLAS